MTTTNVPQPDACLPISLLGLDDLTAFLIMGLVLIASSVLSLILLPRAWSARSWVYLIAGMACLLGLLMVLFSLTTTC